MDFKLIIMRKINILILLLLSLKLYSQNVNIEITDLEKETDGIKYATLQYVNSSYSYLRPTAVFVMNKEIIENIYSNMPDYFYGKQEYTDVFFLGIENFDSKNIKEVEKKIIDDFLDKIIKFRAYSELPFNSKEDLQRTLFYIAKSEELCANLSCSKKILKKK